MTPPRPWSLTDVVLAAAAPFIGLGLTMGLSGFVSVTPLETLVLLASLSGVVTIAICYGLARSRGLGWADLGCRSVPPKIVLRALLATPAVMVAMGLAGAAAAYLVEGELINHQLQLFADAPRALPTAFLALLALGVVVPLAEELLFRGLLFGALEARVSPPMTVGITAVIFGVYHGQPGPVAACTVMGLVLGWIRLRTDSIWPTVTIHAANNLLVGVGMLWYWCTQ